MTVYAPSESDIERGAPPRVVIDKWLSSARDLGQKVYEAVNNL
jgi:hypothetical protein